MSSPYRYVARTTNRFIGMAMNELGGQTCKSRLYLWLRDYGMRARFMPLTKRKERLPLARSQAALVNDQFLPARNCEPQIMQRCYDDTTMQLTG